MYNPSKQYRCTIIRGKSQNEMDDLLPAYAKVIDEICPCTHEDFESLFNNAFQRFLPESERIKKTLDNHRTEVSGKLFGMYYFADDGMVYESERTNKYLEDNDQPAFFKDICFKMQFPNGMQKVSTTVVQRVRDEICIRPNAFVIRLLQVAEEKQIEITKKTLGYYVLNSLDVLQGKATPEEVIAYIANDQKAGLIREIHATDDEGKEKASSFKYQHINEQINYLELANLIRIVDSNIDKNDKRVVLNPKEAETIKLFSDSWNEKPEFDVYSYDLGDVESRRIFQTQWDSFFARLCKFASMFDTDTDALTYEPTTGKDKGETKTHPNLTEFGDEGESIVYEYEKARVSAFNARLANKVIAMGKIKGIGYDIQSVIAEPGDEAEFVKYIEVKSTKRYTTPDLKDSLWIDNFNITRNEWVAAHQHKDYYFIYRLFFTRNGVFLFVIGDIDSKIKDGRFSATPTIYRCEYSNNCVDGSYQIKIGDFYA